MIIAGHYIYRYRYNLDSIKIYLYNLINNLFSKLNASLLTKLNLKDSRTIIVRSLF